VIIGGLTRNETQESESGIPFLKDIPFFGNLFKYTRHSVVKKDLVIFVTPRIIRNYIGNVELSEPSAEVGEQGAPQMQKVDAPAAQPAPQAAPAAEPAAQPAPAAEPAPAPAQEPAPAAEPAPAPEPAAEAPAAPEPATNDVQDDWN
jgi:type IV pilus assembly protein PilQ